MVSKAHVQYSDDGSRSGSEGGEVMQVRPAHRDRMPAWKLQAARQMRKQPTPAEAALWRDLRGRIDHWHRQWPMFGYIADFCSTRKKIIVEVDGPIHEEQAEYDRKRDAILTRYGYTVLRFTNEAVFNDRAAVLAAITQAGADLTTQRQPPPNAYGRPWRGKS